MESQSEFPLSERLSAIASFLPVFQQEDEYQTTEVVQDFAKAAYKYGWVKGDFDWPKWVGTPEANALMNDSSVLAQATIEQLACLMTAYIRQDRFCENFLEVSYRLGSLTGIAQRAATLLEEQNSSEINGYS